MELFNDISEFLAKFKIKEVFNSECRENTSFYYELVFVAINFRLLF